jgi:4a-hydroxytetrahydrobiopterin dehydratase
MAEIIKTPNILSENEIAEKLKNIPGWEYKENKISKKFKFNDFLDSLGFINSLAPFFEENDHHPDTHIFYSEVLFELQRFDVGGKVTDKDFLVAEEIEKRYKERG